MRLHGAILHGNKAVLTLPISPCCPFLVEETLLLRRRSPAEETLCSCSVLTGKEVA